MLAADTKAAPPVEIPGALTFKRMTTLQRDEVDVSCFDLEE